MDHRSKTVTELPKDRELKVIALSWADPETRAATEDQWKCAFRSCRIPASAIVKIMTDGAVDDEYLVCMIHADME